jgi:hypothetical protein
MSTRFKSNSKRNYDQQPLVTGYESTAGSPDLFIPSCGVEDVDVALFSLFEKEIVAQYGGIDSAEVKKVPVIFAAGEKWALLKNGRLIRDRNNSLILPLITIMRTDINQNAGEDVVGRGINQQLGEIVVKRRLDKTDRDYQRLINRLLIPNQSNLSTKPSGEAVSSDDRRVGELSTSRLAKDGAYLSQNRLNNVYETIVVPAPQFYTLKYQITIWTQYTQHANQILEKIFSSFLPQGQSWRLESPKGYWFIARVEQGSFATETNFEDMSQQERYIKHTFSVDVPAYFFATSSPGSPVPIKRYVSSPSISFESAVDGNYEEPEDPYVLGSDDPTLPIDEQKNNRADQRTVGWRQQKVYPVTPDPYGDFSGDDTVYSADPVAQTQDPATSTLPRGHYVKVVSKNSKGETVYTGTSLDGLEIVVTK